MVKITATDFNRETVIEWQRKVRIQLSEKRERSAWAGCFLLGCSFFLLSFLFLFSMIIPETIRQLSYFRLAVFGTNKFFLFSYLLIHLTLLLNGFYVLFVVWTFFQLTRSLSVAVAGANIGSENILNVWGGSLGLMFVFCSMCLEGDYVECCLTFSIRRTSGEG